MALYYENRIEQVEVVEAMQYNKGVSGIIAFVGSDNIMVSSDKSPYDFYVKTSECNKPVHYGDYIVKYSNGTYEVFKPRIFNLIYRQITHVPYLNIENIIKKKLIKRRLW